MAYRVQSTKPASALTSQSSLLLRRGSARSPSWQAGPRSVSVRGGGGGPVTPAGCWARAPVAGDGGEHPARSERPCRQNWAETEGHTFRGGSLRVPRARAAGEAGSSFRSEGKSRSVRGWGLGCRRRLRVRVCASARHTGSAPSSTHRHGSGPSAAAARWAVWPGRACRAGQQWTAPPAPAPALPQP